MSKNNFNYYKITFNSKLVFRRFKKYFVSYSTANDKIIIPKEIMNAKEEIKLEFLKAFFGRSERINFAQWKNYGGFEK